MSTSLQVFHQGDLIGRLVVDEQGELSFSYSDAWLSRPVRFEVSVSLPLHRELVRGGAAHAFFAGLLPEGQVRSLVTRRLGLSEGNDAALLEALGAECAGALSILPNGVTPQTLQGGYERLEPGIIAQMARRRSVFATAVGEHRARLSLAGAQDKLPVATPMAHCGCRWRARRARTSSRSRHATSSTCPSTRSSCWELTEVSALFLAPPLPDTHNQPARPLAAGAQLRAAAEEHQAAERGDRAPPPLDVSLPVALATALVG